MTATLTGTAIGALVGVLIRAVPPSLGVATAPTLGGTLPLLCVVALLAIGWRALFFVEHRASWAPRAFHLAVGALAVAALVSAGPVMGLYFTLLPIAVLTPLVLFVSLRHTNV